MSMATVGRAVKYSRWCSQHISVKVYLCVTAVLIGAVAGVAAHSLKYLINMLASLVKPALHAGTISFWVMILPVVGILLTGIYVRYILKIDIYRGAPMLIKELEATPRLLPSKLMIAPIIANTLTLGMGGSAGPDDPIAYSSAAIGSNISRWLVVPQSFRTLFVACGAGAGIAGIFTAPVGGILYSLEVLRYPMKRVGVLLLTLCCLTSGMVAFVLAGMSFDVTFDYSGLPTWSLLATGVILGIISGTYSFYYALSKNKASTYFGGMKNRWKANLLSGLAIGVMVMAFPVLYSMGYDTIIALINGNDSTIGADFPFYGKTLTPLMMLAIGLCVLLLKGFANGTTMSGGGVAGDFTPSLFAGAVTGFVFVTTANVVFGLNLPLPILALMGMSGVMAGVIGAPLTAIFITIEMSGAYHYFLPVTVVACVSVLVKRFLDIHVAKNVPLTK